MIQLMPYTVKTINNKFLLKNEKVELFINRLITGEVTIFVKSLIAENKYVSLLFDNFNEALKNGWKI